MDRDFHMQYLIEYRTQIILESNIVLPMLDLFFFHIFFLKPSEKWKRKNMNKKS